MATFYDTDPANLDQIGTLFSDTIRGWPMPPAGSSTNDPAPNDDDIQYGLDGNDFLYGGTGNDFQNGGTGNDYLNGGYGNDRQNGDSGDDALYGGPGNDSVNGGTGNDALFGVDPNPSLPNPGLGEIDSLWGDTGDDRFYLGNTERVFYDSGEAAFGSVGLNDYARIRDFTDGEDAIYLKGSETYTLGAVAGGTRIYHRELLLLDEPGPGGPVWGFSQELIGLVEGVNPNNLNINAGPLFTTIT